MSFGYELPQPTTLTGRLSGTIWGMVNAVLGRTGHGAVTFALSHLIRMRVTKVGLEMNRLLTALRDGTLRTRRAPAVAVVRRVAAAPVEPAAPLPPKLALPRGFGWLLRLIPAMGAHRGQVEALLAEPEMASLLAANPLLVRKVAPLCWMLAIPKPGSVPKPPKAPRELSDFYARRDAKGRFATEAVSEAAKVVERAKAWAKAKGWPTPEGGWGTGFPDPPRAQRRTPIPRRPFGEKWEWK